jgi:hypothetical protein
LFFLFVLLLWGFNFHSYFLSILSTLSSPFSHPYSHPFTLLPSPVLKSIVLIPNYSFCPFSPTLLLPSPSPPILPQPVTTLPLPPIHSLPADPPTIPTLHSPNSLQSLTQAPYTTATEIHPSTHKSHKTQQPPHCFPHSPTPLLASCFSATLTNSPNFYS